MEFRITDTFTDGLVRLTGQEQKAVKTTAFDLQLNPASPGHWFQKLDRSMDLNFWSISVNRDIRLIVHRTREVMKFLGGGSRKRRCGCWCSGGNESKQLPA